MQTSLREIQQGLGTVNVQWWTLKNTETNPHVPLKQTGLYKYLKQCFAPYSPLALVTTKMTL